MRMQHYFEMKEVQNKHSQNYEQKCFKKFKIIVSDINNNRPNIVN